MVGGTLDEFGLRDLIQVYCTTRQTARLTLTYPDATGHLYFDQGEIVHAALGPFTGRAAVQAALARPGGTFQVDVGLRPAARTITESWSAIVLDSLAQTGQTRAKAPAPAKSSDMAPNIPAPAVPAVPAARSTGSVPVIPRAEEPRRPTAPSVPPAAAPAAASPPPRPAVPPAPAVPPLPPPPLPRATDGDSPFVPADPTRPPRSPSSARPTPPPFRAGRSRVALMVGVGVATIAAVAAGVAYLRSASVAAPANANPIKRRDTTIVLGMSAAMTGPAKELGRQMRLGIETSLNAVNDAGGIHGHKFKLVALDDGYEPDRTKAAMKELVEDRKVFAIIGNVGTPTAEVSLPYVLEKQVPFFGAFTGAALLRKEPPDRYVFNYRASYVEETSAAVRYLVEIRKVKPNQIAVFAQQDGFGDAGFAGVTKALRKYGRDKDQVLRVGFKRNTLEIGDAVDTILKNRNTIKAVVMVAPYRPAARFIEKVREQKLDAILTNVSFVGSTSLAEELRQLGPAYSTGVVVTQVVPPIDSSATAAIRYRDALQKYFRGEKPDFVSFEGYIASAILLEGFRRAGNEPTRESLVDALENIHGLDLGIGTPIQFGLSEHQGSHKVWGTMLDDKANFQVIDLE